MTTRTRPVWPLSISATNAKVHAKMKRLAATLKRQNAKVSLSELYFAGARMLLEKYGVDDNDNREGL